MEKKEKRRNFRFLITSLVGSSAPHLAKTFSKHSIDLKYSFRVTLTFIVCLILEPFRWWEALWWNRRIKKVEIKAPPIFVIGFWRSGTTLLHNLLCNDPHAAYVTTYQTVFPNHILSHSWWFKPIIGQFWPTHRPFDDVRMGLDLPQEEEIALANLQEISFYNFLYFPKDFEKFYDKQLSLRNQNKDLTRAWKKSYVTLIKKSMLNTKGERFISKNPSNMARISHLLEMFPDAKFIFIYRDPYKTVESFYRFFGEVLPPIQVQQAGDEFGLERQFRLYNDMIRRYFRDRNLIPEGNLVELRFEEFRKDPLSGLKQVYSSLNLPGYAEAEPFFQEYLKDVSDFQHKPYSIHPETIEMINAHASDILQRLGYERKD